MLIEIHSESENFNREAISGNSILNNNGK